MSTPLDHGEHNHGGHGTGLPTGQSSGYPSGGKSDFGVNRVTISYHWQGRQWEVDLDPNKIDIMVFGSDNLKKYRPHLPGKAGGPATEGLNHLNPDGTRHKHKHDHGKHEHGKKELGKEELGKAARSMAASQPEEAEEWPFDQAGVMGKPRPVGSAETGSPDDFCWHNPECLWWCVAGDHSPLGG